MCSFCCHLVVKTMKNSPSPKVLKSTWTYPQLSKQSSRVLEAGIACLVELIILLLTPDQIVPDFNPNFANFTPQKVCMTACRHIYARGLPVTPPPSHQPMHSSSCSMPVWLHYFPLQELRWTSRCLRSWSGSVCQNWPKTFQTSPPSPPSPSLGSSPSSSASCPSTAPSVWSTASSSMESKPSSSWVWQRWRPTLHSSLPAQTTDRHLWFSRGRCVCWCGTAERSDSFFQISFLKLIDSLIKVNLNHAQSVTKTLVRVSRNIVQKFCIQILRWIDFRYFHNNLDISASVVENSCSFFFLQTCNSSHLVYVWSSLWQEHLCG